MAGTRKGEDWLVFERAVVVDVSEQLPYGFSGVPADFGETWDDGCPLCGWRPDPEEYHPYAFGGIRADARQGRLPLVVPVKTGNLIWGDYSLEGFETEVAVERKSFLDLFGTFGGRREQFEREIAALDSYSAAAVVIEATWKRILAEPPCHTRLRPMTIYRTVMAWSQRYPRVSWWPCEDRSFAERACFRFLERFLRDRMSPPEPPEKRERRAKGAGSP